MNGEHGSLAALVNLCLSACGRVVVNNTHCRSWPWDVHDSDEQLCSIHSDNNNNNIQYLYSAL